MRYLLRAVTLLLFFPVLATAAHAAKQPQVRLDTTMGAIVLQLDAQKAPATVDNFLRYVKDGFYNGTIFHRVIDGFMIQGGGFTPDMVRKQTRPPVVNEADNGLHNSAGTIAMARTMDPNSATSQFFINVADNTPLDFTDRTPSGWGYCVFGRVIKGMDVVDRIKAVPTTQRGPYSDVPVQPVVIKKAIIIK